MKQPQSPESPFITSRYQNEQQIDHLYNQFESLKSQIYGFEQTSKLRSSHHRNDQFSKDKASLFLQSSKIRKYELELASHLETIHKNNSLYSSKKKQKRNREEELSPSSISKTSKNIDFSKILPKYTSEKEVSNSQPQLDKQQQNSNVSSQLQKNKALFYQLISQSSKVSKKQSVCSVNFEPVRQLLSQFSQYYLELMGKVQGNLKYLNQKLRCLQLIFSELSKIQRIKQQSKQQSTIKEQKMVLDLQRIQQMYETQIKMLSDHYQQRLEDTQIKYREEQLKIKQQSQKAAKMYNDEENSTLKSLLQKAKNVIATKEQLITSLQEENSELRKQIERLNEKDEIYLGYSATTNKMKNDMGQLSEIKKIKNTKEANIEQDEEINFSELGSVKDQSISDWDHSQVDLEHLEHSHRERSNTEQKQASAKKHQLK